MIILVDTNVILETKRTKTWNAFSSRYSLETVEKCVEETQTGMQNRNPQQWIGEISLRKDLSAVHAVSENQRANARLLNSSIERLDEGESDLWAHALSRTDDWVLCGPDVASMRLGVLLGHHDRLVALEEKLNVIGLRSPRIPLNQWFTSRWHRKQIGTLLAEVGKWS